jgi:16S rRNA C967 or C1407 C5-methylase (RsmB/RsmF family)
MQALPKALLNSLKNVAGFDEKAFVAAHDKAERVTSVFINPFKPVIQDIKPGAEVPWHKGGFYLEERPSFTLDPLFHAGGYYVQEAGSMFIAHVMRCSSDLAKPLRVLDLCASPGGKSALINSLINPESLLVSNEVIGHRALTLRQNLSRWGTANTIVTSSAGEKFRAVEETFDVVLVDAPCSGSGLFRKQPEAVPGWSKEQVEFCAMRQKKILADVIPALRSGGTLIYSTCSYSTEENEDICIWLQNEFDLQHCVIPIEEKWGIVDTNNGYRFFPHLTRSEGYYCAVFKKKGEARTNGKKPARPSPVKAPFSWIDADNLNFIHEEGRYFMMNRSALDFVYAYPRLGLRKRGIEAGEQKGNKFVPAQELAWSLFFVKRHPENGLRYRRSHKIPQKGRFIAKIQRKRHSFGYIQRVWFGLGKCA